MNCDGCHMRGVKCSLSQENLISRPLGSSWLHSFIGYIPAELSVSGLCLWINCLSGLMTGLFVWIIDWFVCLDYWLVCLSGLLTGLFVWIIDWFVCLDYWLVCLSGLMTGLFVWINDWFVCLVESDCLVSDYWLVCLSGLMTGLFMV